MTDPETEKAHSVPQRLLLALIRGYQLTLSPYIGRQCRFYPTCSHYASEAIATHGAIRGSSLAARRLGKCHPFHAGGVDMVPEQKPGAAANQDHEPSQSDLSNTAGKSRIVSTHF